jgi:hypothetical protein
MFRKVEIPFVENAFENHAFGMARGDRTNGIDSLKDGTQNASCIAQLLRPK